MSDYRDELDREHDHELADEVASETRVCEECGWMGDHSETCPESDPETHRLACDCEQCVDGAA